jgi:hypothetical protein
MKRIILATALTAILLTVTVVPSASGYHAEARPLSECISAIENGTELTSHPTRSAAFTDYVLHGGYIYEFYWGDYRTEYARCVRWRAEP